MKEQIIFFDDCCKEYVANGLKIYLNANMFNQWVVCCELCNKKFKSLNEEMKK